MTDNTMLEWAKKYAEYGLSVFPIRERGKQPQFNGWEHNCTTDPKAIETIWTRNPKFNIGIATGSKSNHLVVIDVDNHDNDGAESLREWELENGELPETATVITGSGGAHYYYKYDSAETIKNRAGVLDGVDVRADGGLVVAPPSVHPSGGIYEWDAADELGDVPIADANDVVMKLVRYGSKQEERQKFELKQVIKDGERNDQLFKAACSYQDQGMPDVAIMGAVKAVNQANCEHPLDDDEVEKLVNSALQYDKGHGGIVFEMVHGAKGSKIKQSAENMRRAMDEDPQLQGRIRYNEMSYAPEYFGQLPWRSKGDIIGEWTDTDDSYLRSYLDSEYGLNKEASYEDGFNIVASEHSYNPIKMWLESLPKWDGEDHISNLLPDYLGADANEYTGEVMRLFMLGAISRIYEPGCKFDYVLVLVGEQGAGKTTFMQNLAVNEQWYDGNFNTIEGDKGVERLRGKWILEMAELLAVKRQKDVEGFKSFVTTTKDTYRPPYGRRTIDRPRMCVFAATTNDYNFMTDITGNRRYLPITVNKHARTKDMFANPNETREEFKKAWAEALNIYKTTHPKLVLDITAADRALQEQERYMQEDPWIGIIQQYLDGYSSRICASELWDKALGMDGRDAKRPDIHRINQIMRYKINGWHDAGRQRCGNYGRQQAYEVDKDRLVEADPNDLVPF